jgi:hypothetical protein
VAKDSGTNRRQQLDLHRTNAVYGRVCNYDALIMCCSGMPSTEAMIIGT